MDTIKKIRRKARSPDQYGSVGWTPSRKVKTGGSAPGPGTRLGVGVRASGAKPVLLSNTDVSHPLFLPFPLSKYK